MRHEFSDVLNEQVDYFLLGDIQLLEHFKQQNGLCDDLAHAFTHDGRPIIELDNGWYDVEVLGGALVREGLYEPAFEFVLKKRWSRGEASGIDSGYAFTLRGYFD
jgi:hypothetical protein